MSSSFSRQSSSQSDNSLAGLIRGQYPRLCIELGCGDGRMLRWLASSNPEMLVLGIELDKECAGLGSSSLPPNGALVQADCRDAVSSLTDLSVDLAVAVFPDPALIDQARQKEWLPLYQELFRKLKTGALFRLVTELTNDLFAPVSDAEFQKWLEWLSTTFVSIGFSVQRYSEGAPAEYSSRCLDQFRGDNQRIRIATLDLFRP